MSFIENNIQTKQTDKQTNEQNDKKESKKTKNLGLAAVLLINI